MRDDIDMVRLQFEMTAALSAQVETSSDRMLAHQQSILASQPASIPPVGHVRPAGWAGYPPPPHSLLASPADWLGRPPR